VTEHVTGSYGLAFAFRLLPYGNGKWVVCIIRCGCQGQTDDEGCDMIEVPRGQDQEWVYIAHFSSCMRAAIDPNDILAIRNPRPAALGFAP
jgi:hypothetical protein